MRRSQQLIAEVGRTLVLVTALVLGAGSTARAQDTAGDGAASELIDRGVDETASRNYDIAVGLFEEAFRICRSEGCSDAVSVDLYLSLGIAIGLQGDLDKAQKRFEWALGIEENAKPDDRYTTRAVRGAFDDAKAKFEEGGGASPPRPPGQLTDEQKTALETAKKQLEGNDWEGCLQTMIVSTSIQEYGRGKLMLARCQEKGGLLLEARRDALAAKALAETDGDAALLKEIETYLEFLDDETPKIKLVIQSGIRNPVVKIDSTEIPEDQVDEPIPHNPGTAVVEVTGTRGGQPYDFRQDIQFQRRELIELEVRSDVTPYQACLNKARTVAEREECERLFNQEEGLTVSGALEIASYNDTDHVDVFTPSLAVNAVQPTDGWNVGGTVAVDVVTTASRRFDDRRFAASVGGGYKIGPVTPSVTGSFSIETDYISRSGGALVSMDVADKMATPYLGYSFGYDTIGRRGTDYDVFSQELFRHTISAGSSVIFSPNTVGVVAATVQIEEGDQSKPYRHVAMFSPGLADDMPRGASPELVARARLDAVPLERLPLSRQRYALTFRLAHRFEDATIRGSQRVYYDSWGQWGSTTDARFFYDIYAPDGEGDAVYPQLTLGPHARFNIQGATSFWKRTYVAQPLLQGFQLPEFRTADRELGPLFGVTVGAGLRAALTDMLALSVQAEGIYIQFLDHLYIFEKYGLFTASTLELKWE